MSKLLNSILVLSLLLVVLAMSSYAVNDGNFYIDCDKQDYSYLVGHSETYCTVEKVNASNPENPTIDFVIQHNNIVNVDSISVMDTIEKSKLCFQYEMHISSIDNKTAIYNYSKIIYGKWNHLTGNQYQCNITGITDTATRIGATGSTDDTLFYNIQEWTTINSTDVHDARGHGRRIIDSTVYNMPTIYRLSMSSSSYAPNDKLWIVLNSSVTGLTELDPPISGCDDLSDDYVLICKDGIFTGNSILTNKNILIQNATIDGSGNPGLLNITSARGWINITGGSRLISNSTASNRSDIYLNAKGDLLITDSNVTSTGGNANQALISFKANHTYMNNANITSKGGLQVQNNDISSFIYIYSNLTMDIFNSSINVIGGELNGAQYGYSGDATLNITSIENMNINYSNILVTPGPTYSTYGAGGNTPGAHHFILYSDKNINLIFDTLNIIGKDKTGGPWGGTPGTTTNNINANNLLVQNTTYNTYSSGNPYAGSGWSCAYGCGALTIDFNINYNTTILGSNIASTRGACPGTSGATITNILSDKAVLDTSNLFLQGQSASCYSGGSSVTTLNSNTSTLINNSKIISDGSSTGADGRINIYRGNATILYSNISAAGVGSSSFDETYGWSTPKSSGYCYFDMLNNLNIQTSVISCQGMSYSCRRDCSSGGGTGYLYISSYDSSVQDTNITAYGGAGYGGYKSSGSGSLGSTYIYVNNTFNFINSLIEGYGGYGSGQSPGTGSGGPAIFILQNQTNHASLNFTGSTFNIYGGSGSGGTYGDSTCNLSINYIETNNSNFNCYGNTGTFKFENFNNANILNTHLYGYAVGSAANGFGGVFLSGTNANIYNTLAYGYGSYGTLGDGHVILNIPGTLTINASTFTSIGGQGTDTGANHPGYGILYINSNNANFYDSTFNSRGGTGTSSSPGWYSNVDLLGNNYYLQNTIIDGRGAVGGSAAYGSPGGNGGTADFYLGMLNLQLINSNINANGGDASGAGGPTYHNCPYGGNGGNGGLIINATAINSINSSVTSDGGQGSGPACCAYGGYSGNGGNGILNSYGGTNSLIFSDFSYLTVNAGLSGGSCGTPTNGTSRTNLLSTNKIIFKKNSTFAGLYPASPAWHILNLTGSSPYYFGLTSGSTINQTTNLYCAQPNILNVINDSSLGTKLNIDSSCGTPTYYSSLSIIPINLSMPSLDGSIQLSNGSYCGYFDDFAWTGFNNSFDWTNTSTTISIAQSPTQKASNASFPAQLTIVNWYYNGTDVPTRYNATVRFYLTPGLYTHEKTVYLVPVVAGGAQGQTTPVATIGLHTTNGNSSDLPEQDWAIGGGINATDSFKKNVTYTGGGGFDSWLSTSYLGDTGYTTCNIPSTSTNISFTLDQLVSCSFTKDNITYTPCVANGNTQTCQIDSILSTANIYLNCSNSDGTIINSTNNPYMFFNLNNLNPPAPTVNLIFPTNNLKSNQPIQTFFCNATPNGINVTNTSLYVWNSTGNLITQTLINNPINLTLNDDSYAWNCLAYDANNNFAFAPSNYSLSIHTGNPIVSFISPSDNFKSNNLTQAYSCNVTETSTLTSFGINIWNSSNSLIYSNILNLSGTYNSTTWIYTVPYSNNYKWNCFAYDDYGNYNILYNRTITLDNNTPSLSINLPLDNSLNAWTVSLRSTATDDFLLDTVRYEIRNGTISSPVIAYGTMNNIGSNIYNATLTTNATWPYNSSLPISINLTLVVYANDTVGNTINASTYWTLENSVPGIQFINPPDTGLTTNSSINLNIYLSNFQLNYSQYNITNSSGAVIQTNQTNLSTPTFTWTDFFNVSNIPDGNYTLTVITRDILGTTNTKTNWINVFRNVAPTNPSISTDKYSYDKTDLVKINCTNSTDTQPINYTIIDNSNILLNDQIGYYQWNISAINSQNITIYCSATDGMASSPNSTTQIFLTGNNKQGSNIDSNSNLTDTTSINSNITNSIIINSTVTNSNISNMTVINANITDNFIYSGTIIYNGYTFQGPLPLSVIYTYQPALMITSRITPTNVSKSENLIALCNATQTYFNITYAYSWFKNGIQNTTGTSATFIPGFEQNINNFTSSKAAGDQFILACRAYDGVAYSSWMNSSIVTISNHPPSSMIIAPIAPVSLISGGYKTLTISMNVTDVDEDLNTSTAHIHLNKSNTMLISNNCTLDSSGYQWSNINCSIALPYYTIPGAWVLTGTVLDVFGDVASESHSISNYSSVTINQLDSISVGISSIDFGTASPGQTGVPGSILTISNKGNINYSLVEMTAFDLNSSSNLLAANNFCINDVQNTTGCDFMQNATTKSISGASVPIITNTSLYPFVNLPVGLTYNIYGASHQWILAVS